MGNYVIEVGNYVIVSPSELGNYMIADRLRGSVRRGSTGRTACRHEPAGAADHPGAHNPSPATLLSTADSAQVAQLVFKTNSHP
jgi:hypothetical protein